MFDDPETPPNSLARIVTALERIADYLERLVSNLPASAGGATFTFSQYRPRPRPAPPSPTGGGRGPDAA